MQTFLLIDSINAMGLMNAIAIGNRVARVCTAALNRRATDASALPTAAKLRWGPRFPSTVNRVGNPLCRVRGVKVIGSCFFARSLSEVLPF